MRSFVAPVAGWLIVSGVATIVCVCLDPLFAFSTYSLDNAGLTETNLNASAEYIFGTGCVLLL